MNIADIGGDVVRDFVMQAGVSPLVIVGLRQSSQKGRWKLIGLTSLVTFLTDLATSVDSIFGIHQPEWLQWNWIGKLACIVTIVIIVSVLPSDIRQKSGILCLPASNSIVPVLWFLFYCALMGSLHAFSPSLSVDKETLAFQLLMPSLAEEPVYRAILPALLGTAMGSPWKIAGAQLGWWWLAISVYFGLGHAIGWSSQGDLEFQTLPFVLVTVFTMPYGWIAARCGSVWPSVIGHSLNNSTYVAIALLLK